MPTGMQALIDKLPDRSRLRDVVDALAVGIALSMPWSTSATQILILLWFLVLLPTLDRATLRESIAAPAGAVPVAFVALALVGMLWADAPFLERLGGFKSFIRLLAIPLLLAQFRRSGRGLWVIGGFAASCTVLLVLSWTLKLIPELQGHWGAIPGVPVKDYVVQSGEFLLCTFGLAHLAVTAWKEHQYLVAKSAAVLGCAFLANIVFVATSRTSVIVFAALIVVFGWQRFGWKGAVCVTIIGAMLGAAAWASSPYLRSRVTSIADEIDSYEREQAETSSGYRLEFWKKSIRFIATAPIFGHGTGSTEELFRRAKTGDTGISAAVTSNPHNQFLLIGVELGLVGLVFLVGLWIAHGILFLEGGLASWLGSAVVVQSVISSLFNAQLFYFTPGWTYVFGIGVLGSLIMRTSGVVQKRQVAS